VIITRILPFVPGNLLRFLGEQLRQGGSWVECQKRLREEYFHPFVRERLIRELVVFSFHSQGQSLRAYIEGVFQAAKFLQYEATEAHLVNRVVINFHPEVLAQASLLEKPRTREELNRLVGLLEEKFSVARERQRLEKGTPRFSKNDGGNREAPIQARQTAQFPARGTFRCWNCGKVGHSRVNCPSGTRPPGNGQAPGSQESPAGDFLKKRG
jgi:hypothetical protein